LNGKVDREILVYELCKIQETLVKEQRNLERLETPTIALNDEIREWVRNRIRWWILQGQIDLISELIHGGAGLWEEGIVYK